MSHGAYVRGAKRNRIDRHGGGIERHWGADLQGNRVVREVGRQGKHLHTKKSGNVVFPVRAFSSFRSAAWHHTYATCGCIARAGSQTKSI